MARPPVSSRAARVVSLLLGVAAQAVFVTDARADGTADEADAHFRMAIADSAKGSYDSALTHFLQSNRLAPNRNVLFNIGSTYEAMTRFADAYRYYVDALAGETDAAQRTAVEKAIANMTSRVAVVDITTDPPGATLYVDRKDLGSIGRAPRSLALAPGPHRIIAELEGYETRTSEEIQLVVGKKITTALPLVRILGRLRISAEGGVAAEVRVDTEAGAPSCVAPCELSLPPGRRDVWLRAPGHQPTSRSVLVEAHKTTELSATLVPLTGTLVVQTEERDVAVFVDGKPVGFAPVVAQAVLAGTRKVRVELRGFEPLERSVTIEPNKQAELRDLFLVPLRQVTAVSRSLEDVDDAPSSVTILDRRELDAFGYPTVYDALRGVRGYALSDDRVYPSVGARGTSQPQDYSTRVLVTSDGHPMNDGFNSAAGTGMEANVDLHDVDRIEVVRGPGSLLYGTGAFSGVINLVTRPVDAPDEVHAGAGLFDNNAVHGRAGFHHNFGPGRSVWASVQAAYSPGSDAAFPDPAAPSTARIAHRVDSFSAQGTAGRAKWGALTAQWFFHRREVLATAATYGTRFNDKATSNTDARSSAEVRYEPRVGDRWKLLLRAAADHSTYASHQNYDDGSSIDEDDTVIWATAEARGAYLPLPWLKLTGGVELRANPYVKLHGTLTGAESPYLDEEHPYVVGSAYALIEGSPRPWVRFSAGLRGDVYSTVGPIGVPRGALIFKPAEGHVLKVMAGRAFRAPSIFEQFYNDGGYSIARAVDPARGLSLHPESIVTGEVEHSVRFLRDWVALAAVHGSWIEDIIGTMPDKPGSSVVREVNSEAPAVVVGGELEVRREWRNGLMLGATYGYQQARLTGSQPGDPFLANVPEHAASFKCVVPLVEELVSLGFRAALEAPRRFASDDDRRTGTAVVADATLSGAVRKLGLRYTLGVYNMADWHYQTPAPSYSPIGTAPQKGRTLLFDLLWTGN